MAAVDASGLLSWKDFVDGVKCFVEVSDKIADHWEIVVHKQDSTSLFMKKKIIRNLCLNDHERALSSTNPSVETRSENDVIDDISQEMELWDIAEEEDSAVLQDVVCSTEEELCTFEYHIVYHHSYSVPVLYFNIYKSDGKLLSLTQLWNLVPTYFKDRLVHERWTFITQGEHPVLGMPFFQLHPCHTHTLMTMVAMVNKSPCDRKNVKVSSVESNVLGSSKVDIDSNPLNLCKKGSSSTCHSSGSSMSSFNTLAEGHVSVEGQTMQLSDQQKSHSPKSFDRKGEGYKYLTSWLSSVGPVVLLDLPIKYG